MYDAQTPRQRNSPKYVRCTYGTKSGDLRTQPELSSRRMTQAGSEPKTRYYHRYHVTGFKRAQTHLLISIITSYGITTLWYRNWLLRISTKVYNVVLRWMCTVMYDAQTPRHRDFSKQTQSKTEIRRVTRTGFEPRPWYYHRYHVTGFKRAQTHLLISILTSLHIMQGGGILWVK